MVKTMYHIYVIQNTVTHKLYVGLTKNPKRRWKGHRTNANTGRKKNRLYDAMRSYGNDTFTFTVIEEYDTPEACAEAECFWIEFFRSWDPAFGYNLNHGGSLGLPTLETRRKMSEAAKRRGPNNKGRKFSEKAKANMRAAAAQRGANSEIRNRMKAGIAAKRAHSQWHENVTRAAKAREERRQLTKAKLS